MPQHITFSCMHESIVTAYRLKRLPHFKKSWLPDVLVELSSAKNITSTRVKILSQTSFTLGNASGSQIPTTVYVCNPAMVLISLAVYEMLSSSSVAHPCEIKYHHYFHK